MHFKMINGAGRIREVLHAYMLAPGEQRAHFVATLKQKPGAVWNGEVVPGGLIVEGSRPLSAMTDANGDTTYTLTNSDSDYSRPIGSVKLSDIEYLEVLP